LDTPGPAGPGSATPGDAPGAAVPGTPPGAAGGADAGERSRLTFTRSRVG
jgi:hypothetical protein